MINQMLYTCTRIVSLIAVLACVSCAGKKEICRDDASIVEVRVYALPIISETPTWLSTAQVKNQGKFRRTFRDTEITDRVCSALSTLSVAEYQEPRLNYRAFCEIVYSDGQVDSFGIDAYGSVKYNDVQYDGTYNLMLLLDVACIDLEAIGQ